MKNHLIYWILILFINPLVCTAQDLSSSDKWRDYVEELAEETDDTERIEALYTELSYLTEHPFELNTVTAEQLQKLPFLTDLQISNLLDSRIRYGNMLSIYELKNVQGLDFQTIALLLPFVYIGEQSVDNIPFTVNNLLKRGRNDLQIRYDRTFQQKKGYHSQPDSVLEQYPNRKYLGEPFYHSLRYSYSFDDRLQIGMVGEKDAGEPFWNKHHKGYDFYSAHLFLKDMKWLKSLAIGDYKVSFGQGLVISNDFTPGRSAIVAQAERRSNGFRRHYSSNETDFFRGIAATIQLKDIELSLFYSYRKMDAKIENGVFTSIKTDGLHQVVREREKRRTLPMQTIGGNIRFARPNFHIGLSALSYSFGNNWMQPDPKPYNLYYFSGSRNINASIDYLIKNRNLKFYGETAISKNGALASLNALQLTPASYLSFLILHRYYDKKYQAYFGNAFSQNSTVQNEQGVYMGMQWVPFAYWKLSAYADIFRFPWLKYGVDAPSNGKEYMAQLDYTRGRNFSAYIRYKFREKEKNSNTDANVTTSILPYNQHRIRIQFVYNLLPSLLMRTSGDGILYNENNKQNTGFMLAQSIGWNSASIPVKGDLYLAWFHTDDYNSRISSYEKNILYAFNKPSFYGKGIRLAASLRWDIADRLSLSVKVAHTHYTNRYKIGTDLEEIDGSNRTDLYTLLSWKF